MHVYIILTVIMRVQSQNYDFRHDIDLELQSA